MRCFFRYIVNIYRYTVYIYIYFLDLYVSIQPKNMLYNIIYIIRIMMMGSAKETMFFWFVLMTG